jgi:hypothetical protein
VKWVGEARRGGMPHRMGLRVIVEDQHCGPLPPWCARMTASPVLTTESPHPSNTRAWNARNTAGWGRIVSTMRRWPTWLLVGALAALGCVALLDTALKQAEDSAAAPTEGPRQTVKELRAAGVRGTLFYTDRACRLHALFLPTLRPARTPRRTSCAFALSPNARVILPAKTAWHPASRMYARESRGTIEVASISPPWTFRFVGTSPAFKPDGTLTFARHGAVFQWARCSPASANSVAFVGDTSSRCPARVVSRRRLLEATRFGSEPLADLGMGVQSLAWLDDERFAAILAMEEGPWQVVLARFDGHDVIQADAGFVATWDDLSVSSDGRLAFTRNDANEGFSIMEPDGRSIGPLPHIADVRALDWSSNGRWLAVATPASVFLLDMDEADLRTIRLPLVARDLAFR